MRDINTSNDPYASPDPTYQNSETKKWLPDFPYSSAISSPINRILRQSCSSTLSGALLGVCHFLPVVVVTWP